MVFRPIRARATIVVSFVPCTCYKPNRFSVKIRDFPNRIYSQYLAENEGVENFQYIPQYLAEKRIIELGLPWFIESHGMLPDGSHVFTV